VTQQDTLAQAQGEIVTGLIQVYRALGGGWQIRETGCDPHPADTAGPATPSPPAGLLSAPRSGPVSGHGAEMPAVSPARFGSPHTADGRSPVP
jgi:hypothetical protein